MDLILYVSWPKSINLCRISSLYGLLLYRLWSLHQYCRLVAIRLEIQMLNSLLDLQPLTLIEVASAPAMREAFTHPGKGRFECPYWFFQHLDSDGRLVVSSPGGRLETIDALDVMNVIPRPTIRVMAMPASTFLERIHMSHAELARTLSPDCYEPACVRAAQRGTSGFSYYVWFDRPELNDRPAFAAPLMDGERARLLPLTLRRNMPVSNAASSSNWSADSASEGIEKVHAKKASAFIAAALQSKSRTITKLAALDAALQP